MEEKHFNFPVTKKFQVQRSIKNVILTVFLDMKGTIAIDFLEKVAIVNSTSYCELLRENIPYLLNDLCIYVLYSISFQTFFYTDIKNCRRLLIIQYVIAMHLMRWLTNFYDFRFKWTPTAAIGIHSTKAWLSQLVNFKNAIWMWGHFRRTICNKIVF